MGGVMTTHREMKIAEYIVTRPWHIGMHVTVGGIVAKSIAEPPSVQGPLFSAHCPTLLAACKTTACIQYGLMVRKGFMLREMYGKCAHNAILAILQSCMLLRRVHDF